MRRVSRRHIPDRIEGYSDILNVLDSVTYSENVEYPDTPSIQVQKGIKRIQRIYNFLSDGHENLTLVRGSELEEGIKILDTEDTMTDCLGVYNKEERPAIELSRKLEAGVEEDYRNYRSKRDTKKAISQFRHAEKLNQRSIYLVKRSLSERENLLSRFFGEK